MSRASADHQHFALDHSNASIITHEFSLAFSRCNSVRLRLRQGTTGPNGYNRNTKMFKVLVVWSPGAC
jgi:hypothetical protein